MVKRDLEAHGFPNVKLWSRGVDTDVFRLPSSCSSSSSCSVQETSSSSGSSSHRRRLQKGERGYPIYLYAGRVAVEKNVEAFLELDLPGQKWVSVCISLQCRRFSSVNTEPKGCHFYLC